ncbi:MAG: hypothetical protein IPH75_12325 [bacterium]|nr:hypothetical protein [bacterium]
MGIEILISTRGKSIVTVYLKREKPEWGDLSKLILGPTGKARAPLVRKGKTLIVGFSPEAYSEVLK